MFSESKVGDRVFDYTYQEWGRIIDTSAPGPYPLRVEFSASCTTRLYTIDGKRFIRYKVAELFWDEVKPITPPKRPLPELEVDTKIFVWDHGSFKMFKRYFSHFDEDGRPHCFLNGKTSWTGEETEGWDRWDLPKPVLE